MAIVFDAKNESAGRAAVLTIPLTVGASGRDRIVLATVVRRLIEGPTLTSVKFAGMDMAPYGTVNFATHDGSPFALHSYYLAGPPFGPNTLIVTLSGTTEQYANVASYTGADQASPFPNAAATWAVGHSVITATLTVTSQAGAMVVDFLGLASEGGGSAATVGAGQTQRAKTAAILAGGNCGGGLSEEAGAASVVMSWAGTTQNGGIALISGYLMPAADPRARLVAYTDDLASDDRRLLDANGNHLQPWEIRADVWVRYAGWAPPSSVVYDSLVDDPTCGYIEEVSWDSEGDVATTTTSRMDLGEIIIARASGQSTG